MQNHPDRDNFLIINFNNIPAKVQYNFHLTSQAQFTNYDTPYDYHSVMHYDSTGFAIDPRYPTIQTKDPKYQNIIGQKKGVSIADLRRINRMYNCEDVEIN